MTTRVIMVGIANLEGTLVNDLRIGPMIARHPQPRYESTCERCGTRGTVSQRDVSTGAARCRASACGRSPSEPRATLMQTGQTPTAIRSRDSESARAFERQQSTQPRIRWAEHTPETLANGDPDSIRRYINYLEDQNART